MSDGALDRGAQLAYLGVEFRVSVLNRGTADPAPALGLS